MNNQRGLRKSIKITGISLALVLTLFLGAGLDRILLESGNAADRFSAASNYDILGETYDAIRENFVLQEDITDEQLVWGAAWGMIEALGDTGHSTFLNPEETQEWNESISGDFIGIGINVNVTGDLPVVNYPIKNSPALEAGILPGDTIVMIDGVDLRKDGVSADDALDLITGEEGTDVTLQLIHSGETEPYEVTITRATIENDPIEYAMLPNNVLWLRLQQFSRGSSDRLIEGIEWGKEQGATSVILDLRGNPGGYTAEAIAIVGQFVPEGTPVFQEMDNTGAKTTQVTDTVDGAWLEGDLVVLIDQNSASSSEITSSALQESGRAELVGSTTVGTGTVLLPFDLSDGSTAILGIELFLTGEGNDIYHVGVVPDHEVEFSAIPTELPKSPNILLIDGTAMSQVDFDALVDPQLHAAFDLLQP